MRVAVKKDLEAADEAVFAYMVSDWCVTPERIEKTKDALQRALRFHYVLCVVCEMNDGELSREYLSCVKEVSLQAIISATKGLRNPSRVFTRQVIELILKFCFFVDHPIEYGWVSGQPDLREYGFSRLITYIERLTSIKALDKGADALSIISSYFADTSRYVHVHSASFLYGIRSDANDKSAKDETNDLSKIYEALVPVLCLLMIAVRPASFFKGSDAEQYLIRFYVNAKWKAELAALLASRS